jgi:hypothetical protein
VSGTVFDVTAFGAVGDGKTDSTAALQKALDAAGEVQGAVSVPPGTYMTSELRMRRNTSLVGVPAPDYRRPGGSILKLADEKARCLLNITEGIGITVDGMGIEGGRLGTGVHGVMMAKADFGREEDSFRIERSWIGRFTGDGINLLHVWCWTIRHTMVAFNAANGINVEGWDGFVLDCWLSGNGGFGYGPGSLCSVTMTGNRIEWNKEGGVVLRAGSHYNVTGNYIDRSGKAGIAMAPDGEGGRAQHIAVTGNLIYRSGKHAEPDSDDSCHVRMEGCQGVTVTGNTLVVGRDDAGKGTWSPSYGMILKGLTNCVVANNVLHNGARRELVVDRGEHGEGVVVKDNPGSLHTLE